MTTQTEGKTIGDVVRQEADGRLNREVKTIATTTTLDIGSVCKVDGSGNMVPVAGGGSDDVQTFDPASDPSAGNFRFKWTDEEGTVYTTAWIDEAAADSVIETAINLALPDSDAVGITGTAATAIVATFDGTNYTGRYQKLMVMEGDGTFDGGVITITHTTKGGLPNAVHSITATGLAAGVVRITVTDPDTGDKHQTDELAYNTTGANWETELETLAAVIGDDDIKVTGTDIAAGIVLTYSGGIWAGRDIPLVEVWLDAAATATAHVVIDRVAGGVDTPAGVSLEEIASSGSTQQGLFLVRGPCIVAREQINWEGAEPAAMALRLDAVLGITVRDEATITETQET